MPYQLTPSIDPLGLTSLDFHTRRRSQAFASHHSLHAVQYRPRFSSCYAYGLEPRDFHASFEAYLDGRWWLFDGMRQANLDGLVRIGVGRDAAEIAFSTPFGPIDALPPKISIEHADGTQKAPGRTTDTISTEEPAPNAGAR